jgi:peptidyl-prolyl cis-trans isomerase B (cyclophilin B)
MQIRLALLSMAKMNDNQVSKQAQERIKSYEERKSAHQKSQKKKKLRTQLALGTAVGVVVIALGVGVVSALMSANTPDPITTASSESTGTGAPDAALSEDRLWTGSMQVAGIPLTFELEGGLAPQAVASTVSLINSGFYEGNNCHRLTTEGIFVLQCGDPSGDGSGGPGYSYGPVENSPQDDIYPAGTIAMARQGGDGSSMGSQFFLVYENSTIPRDAAGGYSVIGRIKSGLPELIAQVTSQGTANGSSDGAPKIPVTLTSITIK